MVRLFGDFEVFAFVDSDDDLEIAEVGERLEHGPQRHQHVDLHGAVLVRLPGLEGDHAVPALRGRLGDESIEERTAHFDFRRALRERELRVLELGNRSTKRFSVLRVDDGVLDHLGPDLCEPDPDIEEVLRRVRDWVDPRALVGEVLLDLWLSSYAAPPESVTLDIDDTLDVVHGHQQLSLFNSHADGHCFQPIHIYEAATGKPVAFGEDEQAVSVACPPCTFASSARGRSS